MAGLGIALLATMVIAPHLASGALIDVLRAFGLEAMGVGFVTLSRRQQPRAVTLFIGFATETLQRRCRLDPVGKPARARSS